MSGISMQPGQTLASGQSLTCDQGTLTMETYGNLVLFDAKNQTLWTSNTSLYVVESNPRLVMQADGNLVLYTDGTVGPDVKWASGTNGHPGASMTVNFSLDQGYMQINDATGAVIWRAMSPNDIAKAHGILYSGARMNPGDKITTPAGALQFADNTCSLQILDPQGNIKWEASSSANIFPASPGGSVVMQEGGNLVITNSMSQVVWTSNTDGMPGLYFRVDWKALGPLMIQANGDIYLSPAIVDLQNQAAAADAAIQADADRQIAPIQQAANEAKAKSDAVFAAKIAALRQQKYDPTTD